jgi:hypothetical protein
MRYPFELRARGNSLRLRATVRVMTNDVTFLSRSALAPWLPPSGRKAVAVAAGIVSALAREELDSSSLGRSAERNDEDSDARRGQGGAATS